jgi:pimeloyl-ACP methyl ester carboxylesterase
MGWGLGRNNGRVPSLIPRLTERVEEVRRNLGAPVSLVGWSLGGYLAREVARERSDLVGQIVTLGAPVVGGPKYTASAPMYRRRGYDLDEIEKQVEERADRPIEVPITALYSVSDGVVAWRACRDEESPRIRHQRVSSSHLGLVRSPWALERVAEALRPWS